MAGERRVGRRKERKEKGKEEKREKGKRLLENMITNLSKKCPVKMISI